jgi:hypothetical protein
MSSFAQVYEQMISQIEEETGSLPENLPRGVPPETAATNPDVQAIIAPRLTMLMEIANSFLVTIIDSLDDVPYGIRWICKQIRSLTRVRTSISSLYLVSQCRAVRENTRRLLTSQFARLLVVSSSFDSSILLSSHHKRICWLMVFLPNTRGGH